MRAWALWDIVPPEALLYIALTDASKPPRPLGIAKQLKENKANGDPNIAFSRERIYLETSGEPGCVGQCCLVFRKPTAGEGGDVNGHKASNSISSAISKSNTVPDLQSLRGMVPPVPPTPKIQPQAPTSSERRPLLCETKSGRKISDRFLDSPALFSAGITSRGLPSPAMRTPKTADAISSLAAMQALARSFTPSSSSSSKDVDMTRLPDIQETVPRSLESAEVKSVTMTATQKAAISAGRS